MKEEKSGTDSKIIDASVVFGYLIEGKFKEVVDDLDNFLLSTITLFEIKKKMLEKKVSDKEIEEKIDFIKSISTSIPLTDEIAEAAAELSFTHKIPAADSILYATAKLNNAKLITADNDFRGLDNVEILD